MNKACVATVSLFVFLALILPAGCSPQTGGSGSVPIENEEYICVFNRVDELLMGDLADTVSLKGLESGYKGKEIVGLGTTSREHCGEIIFSSGNCYWADPTNQGRIAELSWAEEELPFCAVVRVDEVSGRTFSGASGDLHTYVESKAKDLGVPLAAVIAKGKFDRVTFSVADKLPTNPSEKVDNVIVQVNEGQEWEFVGFYALQEEDQKLISTGGHPVHLHGRTPDGSHGGHLQQANAVVSEVRIYPIDQYILKNRVSR